jgi:hypothetical protein
MPLDSEEEVAEEEWEDPMSSPAVSDGDDSEGEERAVTPRGESEEGPEEEGLFVRGAGPS